MTDPMDLKHDLMCETCKRPLDVLTDLDGSMVGYAHASNISVGPHHYPIPVQRIDALASVVCDFCSTPDGAWRYPTQTFETEDVNASENGEPYGPITPRSVGDWMACDVCHDDIEANRWDALAKRSLRGQPAFLRREAMPRIRTLHRTFVAHRTGPALSLRSAHGPHSTHR